MYGREIGGHYSPGLWRKRVIDNKRRKCERIRRFVRLDHGLLEGFRGTKRGSPASVWAVCEVSCWPDSDCKSSGCFHEPTGISPIPEPIPTAASPTFEPTKGHICVESNLHSAQVLRETAPESIFRGPFVAGNDSPQKPRS